MIKKFKRYSGGALKTRLWLFWLVSLFSILTLLICPTLTRPIGAADPNFVNIIAPGNGSTVASPQFSVSGSYAALNGPPQANQWSINVNITTVEIDPATNQDIDTRKGGYNGNFKLPAKSGSYTANIDFTAGSRVQPSGLYRISIALMAGTPWNNGEIGWSTLTTAKSYFNYRAQSSGGAIPVAQPQQDTSSDSGDSPVGPIIGVVVLGAAGLIGGTLIRRSKGKSNIKSKTTVKTAPGGGKDLYQEWWNKASPQEQQNWESFEKFLISRLGPANLKGFIDQYGRPSWASAYTSWQKEVQSGKTAASFEDWAKAQRAGEQQSQEMMERAVKNQSRPRDIEEASQKYSDALRNKERFEKLNQIGKAVSGDSKLSDFVNDARKGIINDKGEVDPSKLARLENTLQRWIVRDKMGPQTPDYTSSDAYYDTVKQASQNILIRGGAAYLTAGYSEMALNPLSSLSTMRQSIMDGKSTLRAVTDGYVQSSLELAVGESGRLVKYASPYIQGAKESYNLSRLSSLNSELGSEVSTINQLAKQTEGLSTRNAFMKSNEVAKLGQTSYKFSNLEKQALELNNNPEFRELLAKNSDLVPGNVKEVIGVAKQKAYEQSRNNAIGDVMNQMGKDGMAVENPLFIKQTGTHAKPDNPGWNSLKSDFDHTVDFGSSNYNQLYEDRFNSHLASQGTSASAIDANVYGAGTSSRGSYSGGAMKFVENYNQTTGSDIMIRNVNGQTVVSRETPQTINSLLGKMQPNDIASTKANYQNFFDKSISKGGSVDNLITNSSKEVSRTAGQYSVNYAEHFHNTGNVNYQVPNAAKVADLVKKQGFSVDNAMQKVSYSGSKSDLLNDFKKIMGR